jgi:GAF domain-containing protein
MKAPRAELALLQEIGTLFYAGKTSRDEARSAVIDVIFRRLRCSRVSLWRFDGGPGALRLLCFASKVAGQSLVTTERWLAATEFGPYFDGLVRDGTYLSNDAMTDSNLQPMHDNYLVPNDVRSMLDAAFMVNGRAYGMVCCEQTHAIRAWRAAEVADLRAMVAKLAMLMTSAQDDVLWAAPSLPMRPIAEADSVLDAGPSGFGAGPTTQPGFLDSGSGRRLQERRKS